MQSNEKYMQAIGARNRRIETFGRQASGYITIGRRNLEHRIADLAHGRPQRVVESARGACNVTQICRRLSGIRSEQYGGTKMIRKYTFDTGQRSSKCDQYCKRSITRQVVDAVRFPQSRPLHHRGEEQGVVEEVVEQVLEKQDPRARCTFHRLCSKGD